MAISEKPRPLMTISELAEYLTVPVATIYQWRTKGTGPRGIKAGRHLRFRPEDVAAWLGGQPPVDAYPTGACTGADECVFTTGHGGAHRNIWGQSL